MKITVEMDLYKFEFWGHAKEFAEYLKKEEFEEIEEYLNETCEVWLEEDLNDLFLHHDDDVAKILGYENADELITERRG